MKVSSIFILIILMVALCGLNSSAEHTSDTTERWDLLMIKEARIWKNLLTDYVLADKQEYWPERKAALEKIIHESPDSRWADDAALILACGKASFENDTFAAIDDLKKISDQYPDGQTVVSLWDPNSGCRFDQIWLMWQAGLVFLNEDGTVRAAKPFDKAGKIYQLEKEALAYFGHLQSYPRATKIMARLFISEMLGHIGDRAGAIAVLEKIVSDSNQYLPLISRADKIATSRSDGYYIRNLIRRPEYRAYLSLIGYYEKQNQVGKAVEMADQLFNICSKDGWLWGMNKQLGDFYSRHNLFQKAKQQYQLSLKGLMDFRKSIDKRSRLVEGSDIPDNFWVIERRELEKKLADLPAQSRR